AGQLTARSEPQLSLATPPFWEKTGCFSIREMPTHIVAAGGQLQSYCWLSAAASKPTLLNGVAGLLAFAEELHIRHDRLVGMVRPPMRNVCLVIRNTDHQTRSARAPITRGPHRTSGPVEQILQIRHGVLPWQPRRARFPLRSAADCPALSEY